MKENIITIKNWQFGYKKCEFYSTNKQVQINCILRIYRAQQLWNSTTNCKHARANNDN